MKKLLFLLVAVAAMGGAAAWFLMRPTGVQVQALLTPDGPDVTDMIEWDVDGVLSRASAEGITLGMVEGREASARDPTFYPLQPGQITEVDGRIRGNVEISSEVSPARGEVVEEVFVLNAGIVQLKLQASDGMDMRLEVASGSTVTSYFPEGDSFDLFLSDGDYTISFVNNSADVPPQVAEVSVAAGDTQEVALDARVATVRFALDTGFDWPADLSTLGYLVTGDSSFGGGALRYFDETGLTAERVLAFGEHQIELQQDPTGNYQLRPIEPISMMIDADGATIPVPVEMQKVNFTVAGAPADLADRRIRIVESTYKGEYVASRQFEGDTTSIVYDDDLYDAGSVSFAVFLRGGSDNLVVGTVDLGPYAPGTESDVTITYGEGLPLCNELFGAEYCLQPE